MVSIYGMLFQNIRFFAVNFTLCPITEVQTIVNFEITRKIEMALIKCHECSSEISTEAKNCPKCGAKNRPSAKAKTSFSFSLSRTGWLVIGLVILVASYQQYLKSEADATITPEQRSADAQRKAKYDKQLLAALTAARIFLKGAREPDSVKVLEARVNDEGTVVCAKFSGRNGFGGVSAQQMAFIANLPSTSEDTWNKYCLKPMSDFGALTQANLGLAKY
jgi:hypothetical protein